MSYTVKDIVKVLENRFPLSYAENWDNCGLFCGGNEQVVNRILVALDPTLEVIESAISKNVDMIITHHPLTISKLAKVNTNTIEGKKIEKLIKNNIALYSAHTNLDVEGIINKKLATLFGLKDTMIFIPTNSEALLKIVCFVPTSYLEEVRTAMCDAGAGHIGKYSDCSFYTKGTGTFLPKLGTTPFVGELGEFAKVEEAKLETIVPASRLNQVISAMIKVHPYEEVAYDVYKTERKTKQVGFGEIGQLEQPLSLSVFVNNVKEVLGLEHISFAGDEEAMVQKVAICSGSGLSFLVDANNKGADVYVTGDLKYHDAILAKELGVSVIDATHYSTENIIVDLLGEYLETEIEGATILLDDIHKNPIKVI